MDMFIEDVAGDRDPGVAVIHRVAQHNEGVESRHDAAAGGALIVGGNQPIGLRKDVMCQLA